MTTTTRLQPESVGAVGAVAAVPARRARDRCRMKGRALAMASWYTKASLAYCVFLPCIKKRVLNSKSSNNALPHGRELATEPTRINCPLPEAAALPSRLRVF